MRFNPAPTLEIEDAPARSAATVLVPTTSSVLDVGLVAAIRVASDWGDPVVLVLNPPRQDDEGAAAAPLLDADERADMFAAIRAVRAVIVAGDLDPAAARFAPQGWVVPYGEAAVLATVIDALACAGFRVRLGPAFPGREAADLLRRIAGGRPTPAPGSKPPAIAGVRDRIVAAHDLAQVTEAWHAEGRRIVTVNGCFDLLHPGHLRFLAGAAELGEVLVVLINSDASVRGYKGDARPFLDQGARATVLAAVGCVDHVVVFDADTPLETINRIRPAVHCKGGTYEPDRVADEKRVVESHGGRLEYLPMVGAYSSTDLATRIRGAG